MKRIIGIVGILILFASISSCSKDRTYPEVTDNLKNGSWRIAEFIHVDRDETDLYNKYRVVFTTQETVTASGINFYRGKWRITSDGDLQMDWGRTYQFEKFNAIWNITNNNDQMIQLDIVGGTDHLVFEKIQ